MVPSDRDEETLDDGDEETLDDDGSTASLDADAHEPVLCYGRMYSGYKPMKYLWPVDEKESIRLECIDDAIYFRLQKSFLSPIPQPKKILDIGCGNGSWCIRVAETYLDSLVIGVDISPIPPPYVPPNCLFQVFDVEDRWTFRKADFDLIHVQNLRDHFSSWPSLLQNIYDHLKPGGYVEICDVAYCRYSPDDSIPNMSPMSLWEEQWKEICAKLGNDSAEDWKKLIVDLWVAGFSHVIRDLRWLPIGNWPVNLEEQKIGSNVQQGLKRGLGGMSIKPFLDYQCYSLEALKLLLAGCDKELSDEKVHACFPLQNLTAQRPNGIFNDESFGQYLLVTHNGTVGDVREVDIGNECDGSAGALDRRIKYRNTNH